MICLSYTSTEEDISVDVLLRSYQTAIPGDTHPLMSRELVMWLAITKFDLKYAKEWVSDYCLTPKWAIFQLYHGDICKRDQSYTF
jgi:hypothetical protein